MKSNLRTPEAECRFPSSFILHPSETPMPRIRLVHWNAAEAEERSARLRAAGYEVDCEPLDGEASVRAIRHDPPDAVVIDLSRLPSHGRAVALVLREQKATRQLPLLFV